MKLFYTLTEEINLTPSEKRVLRYLSQRIIWNHGGLLGATLDALNEKGLSKEDNNGKCEISSKGRKVLALVTD